MRGLFTKDPGLAKGLVVSLVLSTILLLVTRGQYGDLLDGFTDHLHHTRATWTFLHVGLDAYREPFGATGGRVPYPQEGVTWEDYPIAYPPGMFVVFLPPAVIGRFAPPATFVFGKVVIAYLLGITHVALWSIGRLMRRLGSPTWNGLLVVIWIFCVRFTLLGFYDGAWLLTAALGVHALVERRPARSLLWFVLSALISYRAAALAPVALVAFVQMLRGGESVARKAAVTLVAAASGAVVAGTFWMLMKYSPHRSSDAQSFLLPLGFRGGFILAFGAAVGALTAWRSSVLVGACVITSSVLAVLHAGHSWHGCLCLAPVFALTLASRRPVSIQLLIGFWMLVCWDVAFLYAPLQWLEELLTFVERGAKFRI